jgi:hypothetical protein
MFLVILVIRKFQLDFLARLAALVARARAHLTHYHGMFAPLLLLLYADGAPDGFTPRAIGRACGGRESVTPCV